MSQRGKFTVKVPVEQEGNLTIFCSNSQLWAVPSCLSELLLSENYLSKGSTQTYTKESDYSLLCSFATSNSEENGTIWAFPVTVILIYFNQQKKGFFFFFAVECQSWAIISIRSVLDVQNPYGQAQFHKNCTLSTTMKHSLFKGFKVGIKVFFAKQCTLNCGISQQGSSAF